MSKLRPTDSTGLGFDKNEFSHTKFGFSDLLMATPNDKQATWENGLPNEGCPRPDNQLCNELDAEICCGGGSDMPCDCEVCHPEQVAQLKDQEVTEWTDALIDRGNPHLATTQEQKPWQVNHFTASVITPEIKTKIASLGLQRVAGNLFACPSTTDFWQVQGNKIIKLVGTEVDNGDKLAAAPEEHPQEFINNIMADLEF